MTSGLNQAPSLRAQASNGAPATNPASILHLSFYWTACCPRPCAGARGSQRTSQPLPSRSPQAQGEGGGERCEQRIRAQFEALNGGSLSSRRRGSKLAEAGEGQQGGWETVLSSRHLGWTSEPQLTPAEFSAPSQLLGQERRALLRAQRRLRRGRPLWSPELWVTQVRRIVGLRGADSLLPWAAPSFSPTATDRLLHPRDPKGERAWPHLREAASWHSLPESFTSQFVGHSDGGQSRRAGGGGQWM